MIDFACRQFKLDEVIKCGLGLSRADFRVMENLAQEQAWTTSEEIADRLGLSLSTVQRAVKKLSEDGIIDRTQSNLDGGGYVFEYRMKDRPVVRKIIIDIVRKWLKRVETEIEKW